MNPHIQFMDPTGKVLLEKNLENFPLKIGRAPENDISVNHPSISRFHCRIEIRNGKIWLVDLDSVNGIRVQNERLKEMPLVGSLDFKLGEIRVLFRGSLAEASETMEATRIVGNGARVEPPSGLVSGLASSDEKTARFTLSNVSTSGSSASPLNVKIPSPQLPSSEEATVVRRPAKPVPMPGTLPELKKPGTGFEDSTQTSFQLRSGAPSRNPKDGVGADSKSASPAKASVSVDSEEDSASGVSGFLQALRGTFSGFSLGRSKGKGGASSPWFKSAWSMGIWIGAGFLFAFALSWWDRTSELRFLTKPTTKLSTKSSGKLPGTDASTDTSGESVLPRSAGDSSSFWSRSGTQAESLEKFLEQVSRRFLDSRAAENEP
ncbi:MAG: FHA domain-containing protein [Bdellovibrio sp.]